MYDVSDGGKQLRRYTSANLAWWHTYKHVGFTLWKLFADSIFAKIWHALYPGHTFFVENNNWPSCQAHMLYVHLVYPSIRVQLREAFEQQIDKAHVRVTLENMLFLCEFAIPVVS